MVNQAIQTQPTGIKALIDSGSFRPWQAPFPAEHTPAVIQAQQRTGFDEAVQAGRARIRGHEVAVIGIEFAFIGGTIGTGAAAWMVAAITRATSERLPLIITTSSGGTRVTEGTSAFVTMVSITAALCQHKRAGLIYLAYLRDPTLGGAFASWGSLAHLTIAENGATVGFLGPKVHRAITGLPMPVGVQTAETLHAIGVIDYLATDEQARGVMADFLDCISPYNSLTDASSLPYSAPASPLLVEQDAWQVVNRSREPERPGAVELLRLGWDHVFFLSSRPEPLRVAVANGDAGPTLVIAQQRGIGALKAADFARARHALELARDLCLPVMTIIDTSGADSSPQSEREGIGGEVGATIASLLEYSQPIVSVLLGQGTGAGAIALLPADHTIAAENSWLAPLPPEGVNAVLHRSEDHLIAMAAESQGLTPTEMYRTGIIDQIVTEPRDLHSDADKFAARIRSAVNAALTHGPYQDVVATRTTRYLTMSTKLVRKRMES